MYPDILKHNLVIIRHAYKEAKGQYAGHSLTKVCCNCSTYNTHIAEDNEHDIHNYIGYGSCSKIYKGTLGIAGRIQDACSHIIKHIKYKSYRKYLQVACSIIKNLSRSTHKDEYSACEEQSQYSKHNAKYESYRNRGVYGLFDIFSISCTKILRNDNACTNCCTLSECYKQVDKRGSGTNCCKSIAADIIADDDGIHGIIGLLQ